MRPSTRSVVPEEPSITRAICWLAFEDKRPVRLDLSAVRLIDSRGVVVLRHLGANEFEFVNCPEFVRELLRTP